jgi:hypothetical protein
MNKITKALKALGLIVQKPYLLNNIIEEESVWKQYIENTYNLPYGLPLIEISELFHKEYPILEMDTFNISEYFFIISFRL